MRTGLPRPYVRFHAFKWWDANAVAPMCLLIANASQRRSNHWPAFIAHSLLNGDGLLLIVAIAH